MTTPNRLLTHIRCPGCGRDVPLAGHGEVMHCAHCRANWPLTGRLCPHCNHFHQSPARLCLNCERPLARMCNHCRTLNWSGDEFCLACQEPLDVGDIIRRHDPATTVNRLDRQQADARRLKEMESFASDERMAELMAGEDARLAELRRRHEIVRRRERRLLFFTYALLFLFLVSIAAYVILIR